MASERQAIGGDPSQGYWNTTPPANAEQVEPGAVENHPGWDYTSRTCQNHPGGCDNSMTPDGRHKNGAGGGAWKRPGSKSRGDKNQGDRRYPSVWGGGSGWGSA